MVSQPSGSESDDSSRGDERSLQGSWDTRSCVEEDSQKSACVSARFLSWASSKDASREDSVLPFDAAAGGHCQRLRTGCRGHSGTPSVDATDDFDAKAAECTHGPMKRRMKVPPLNHLQQSQLRIRRLQSSHSILRAFDCGSPRQQTMTNSMRLDHRSESPLLMTVNRRKAEGNAGLKRQRWNPCVHYRCRWYCSTSSNASHVWCEVLHCYVDQREESRRAGLFQERILIQHHLQVQH